MIRFEHVTRRYEPGGRPALEDVSVEFLRGEFVFLIGASGSGKSTLLRMILREGLPQQGKITVAGQNLGLMLEHRVPAFRRSIGMVFQDFRLLPDKTVHDNVAFAMRVTGATRAQIRQRVPEVLEKVGLADLARRLPHEISGGEQQRAAIARAMVNEPAVLLADEPTGNLDPHASDEVVRALRRIHSSGTTVIMATHDRAIVDRARRRVVQLHEGRLVRDERRGTYDPRTGTEAWQLLREAETTGTLRPIDPRAAAPDAAPDAAATSPPTDAAGTAGAASSPPASTSVGGAARAAGLDQPGGKPVDAPLTPAGTGSGAPTGPQVASPEAVQVSWPEHLRRTDAAEDLPEPAGDFSGSELPDLDRDGFVESDAPTRAEEGSGRRETAPRAAAGSVGPAGSAGPAAEDAESPAASAASGASGSSDPSGSEESASAPSGRSTRHLPPEPTSVPKLRDVGWLAASGPPLPFRSASSADAPSGDADRPRSAESDPATGEREHDVIEDAVAEHSPSSAGPEGEAAKPQTSWLPHADARPVDRAGVEHGASAVSPHEPDVEDRRLAGQSADDEPPVAEPALDPHQGVGPEHRSTPTAPEREARPFSDAAQSPTDVREHDVIEDAVAEHSPSSAGPEGEAAKPQTSWLPHADARPVDRAGVEHGASAVSPDEPDVEDRRLAGQSADDEPPVAEPALDPHQGLGPAPDSRLQARRRAARPLTGHDAEGDAGTDEGGDQRAAADDVTGASTPAASQSAGPAQAEPRRSADQPGGRRSLWRRLRRK